MRTLSGEFQIKDWQETTQSEGKDQTKRNLANVKLTYSGDLTGDSELQYLLHYHSASSTHSANSADFVGFENIDAGADGHISLRHSGKFISGVASSQFEVVSSSIDESLVGKKGQFTSGENGMATYMIELDDE